MSQGKPWCILDPNSSTVAKKTPRAGNEQRTLTESDATCNQLPEPLRGMVQAVLAAGRIPARGLPARPGWPAEILRGAGGAHRPPLAGARRRRATRVAARPGGAAAGTRPGRPGHAGSVRPQRASGMLVPHRGPGRRRPRSGRRLRPPGRRPRARRASPATTSWPCPRARSPPRPSTCVRSSVCFALPVPTPPR